ncbi:MAG: hypothetical protein FWB85_03315 [Chitinispirillia bacterium]|nr:hypothetical protein [Chitinispirillia bacterium]MCL2241437.1 hypothetical protein [Chitinispirillia bacterium]
MDYCRIVLMACLLWAAAMSSAVFAQSAAAAKHESVAVDQKAAEPAQRGRDIDALLADDEGEDLLAGYKPAVHAKDTVPADLPSQLSTGTDGQAAGGEGAVDGADAAVHADQSAPVHSATPGGRRGAPVSAAAPVETGPVVIEEGRTINFAQNLKEYRSPRLAMLLSLLVPGLGQAYSRSYVKAGAFGAAEAAIIGVAAYLNSVGNSKKRDAHKFADDNFDVDRLKAYDVQLQREFEERIDREEISDWTFFPPYDTSFYNAAGKKQPYYYESIRGSYFAPGWSDNELSLDRILSADAADTLIGADKSKYVLYNTAHNTEMPDFFYLVVRVFDNAGNRVFDGPLLGYSGNQAKYNSMVEEANSYHDAVNYTLYALVLNHIASAIDAGFTARAYNARLLGDERSVWNRLSVSQQYVFSGTEVSPGLMLRVRF